MWVTLGLSGQVLAVLQCQKSDSVTKCYLKNYSLTVFNHSTKLSGQIFALKFYNGDTLHAVYWPKNLIFFAIWPYGNEQTTKVSKNSLLRTLEKTWKFVSLIQHGHIHFNAISKTFYLERGVCELFRLDFTVK